MKKKILMLLTIVFLTSLSVVICVSLLVQEEKYTSKEADEYYENYWKNFIFFEPLDTEFILGFQSEYYEIHKIELNYEPYSNYEYQTPYTDSIFSITSSLDYDDWIKFEYEKIGDIYKTDILKYEKKDSIEALVYTSSEYENRKSGIWIGYSENNGKDWNYYYTGIVQGQPVYVKYYSQRPLIKEKGKLEIDACLLRDVPFDFSNPGPIHECVKDGIYLAFDINVISKDSDGDGLTDIVEDKLYTDKYNKDTDGDGIPDNMDTNPRVNYPRTEKSRIYEAILSEDIGSKDKDWSTGRFLFKKNNTAYYVTDSTKTALIVTDDEDLMGIQPRNYRIIFMTTDEYKNNAKAYESELNRIILSPFLKVDNKKNTYKVNYYDFVGKNYLVKKTIIGWRIRVLSMTID